ncbi:MAG: RusA family crossover junction endodeoxyribonuclease [Bacillota bacterium]
MIQFTIYGEPIAQGRPRASSFGGKVRLYDPKKSKDYKHYIKLSASEHAPESLLETALSLEVKIYRPIPKSFSKKNTELAENGVLRPVTKPDADNYLKGIKDGLNKVIWKDDSQIVDVHVSKYYSNKPRIEVKVVEL